MTSINVAENCILRILTEADVSRSYVDGLNDPVVGQYLVGSRKEPQTSESVRRYVKANEDSETDYLFGIFIDDALRGTVRLHDVQDVEATARIGILLFDRTYWGHGWATRAIDAVMKFARKHLKVTKFWAGMRRENLASRKTFEGLGFVYQPSLDWSDESGNTHHFFLCDCGVSRL